MDIAEDYAAVLAELATMKAPSGCSAPPMRCTNA
jgi:hypothetical protein